MKYLATGVTLLATMVLGAATAPAQRTLSTNRPSRAPTSAPVLPTEADIRATFEHGDYAETLKQLTRVLALKGNAAAGYDRYEMTMLKGESQLRLKQFKAAADAFGAAAKLTDDDAKAATARATQRLVTEAKGGRIERRSPAARGEPQQPKSADLLDPAQREDAMRIVHADLRAAAEPKLKAAKRSRTLPPITEALELVGAARDFELALGGGDGPDRAAHDELAARAHDLIAKELASMEADVAQIKQRAEAVKRQRIVERSSISYDTDEADIVTSLVGLSGKDGMDLKTMIHTCAKIIPTAESLTRGAGVKKEDADALADKAKVVSREAERVLNAKYR